MIVSFILLLVQHNLPIVQNFLVVSGIVDIAFDVVHRSNERPGIRRSG